MKTLTSSFIARLWRYGSVAWQGLRLPRMDGVGARDPPQALLGAPDGETFASGTLSLIFATQRLPSSRHHAPRPAGRACICGIVRLLHHERLQCLHRNGSRARASPHWLHPPGTRARPPRWMPSCFPSHCITRIASSARRSFSVAPKSVPRDTNAQYAHNDEASLARTRANAHATYLPLISVHVVPVVQRVALLSQTVIGGC